MTAPLCRTFSTQAAGNFAQPVVSVLFFLLSPSVSMLAVEEYEELQVNLELEKDLRKKAESFAQEVGKLLRTGEGRGLRRTPVGKTG